MNHNLVRRGTHTYCFLWAVLQYMASKLAFDGVLNLDITTLILICQELILKLYHIFTGLSLWLALSAIPGYRGYYTSPVEQWCNVHQMISLNSTVLNSELQILNITSSSWEMDLQAVPKSLFFMFSYLDVDIVILHKVAVDLKKTVTSLSLKYGLNKQTNSVKLTLP